MKYFFSLFAFCGALLISVGFMPKKDNPNPNGTVKEDIPSPFFCKTSPEPTLVVQPDGSSITIIGKGNMNNYWTETTDGYTIVRNKTGIYEYAEKLNGNLIPNGMKANNEGNRSTTELSHLKTLSKSIKPDLNPLKTSVLNQVNAQLKNKTYPTTGNIKILALLIDYPDLDSTFDKEEFDSLLYGSNFRSGDGSFKSFYETSSNGQLTLEVDVEGWFEADSSYIHYGADSGYDRAADLVREAVDAAEVAGVDFSDYDNDGDGDVDGILAIHAGPGAEQGGRGEYIWSHRWVLSAGSLGSVNYDGVRINDYMINPETRTRGTASNLVGIGVICHEFGHNLGLPDLYDTEDSNGDSEGIGEWGLMAGAGYLGGEHRPGNLCAWSKVELGWETTTQLVIGESGEYILPPANEQKDAIFQINTSLSNEYFLLENRQKKGLDSDLQGNGLAIFHINTDKTNSFGNRVNGDENKKGVDLEEADGNADLDQEINRGDNGDLFPGTSVNRTFDNTSTPSSKIDTNFLEADKTISNLEIRNITEVNDTIYFSFGKAPGPPCTGPDTLKTSSGTFTDGSGNTEYAHNQSCSWLIQIPSGTITLSFTKFRTELGNDSVTIYDGNDATAAVLGNFSGTTIPSSLTSSATEMYLEFNTNATINDSGWTASYISNQSCGTDTLNNASGTFTDGSNANTDYSNDLNCSWLIQPAGATSITLDFNRFDVDPLIDRVAVYDGVDFSATLVGTYTGTTIPSTITSTSGSLYLEFTTNSSITARGWEASYTSSTATPCGIDTLTSPNGNFTDGSLGLDYDNDLNCTWLIQPVGAATITFSLDSLNTEISQDKITVYDGTTSSAPVLGSYSGTNNLNTLTSSGGSMFVEFTTNSTITDKGWGASYTSSTAGLSCTGATTFTAVSGSFDDGSGTNDYSNNRFCTWLINPPSGKIELTFTAFKTEPQPTEDRVIVFDGIDATAPRLGSYSGTTIPPVLTSSSNALYLEFRTNGKVVDEGWEATYKTIDIYTCKGEDTLTASTGTIDDGSGTNNYSDTLNCTWLIQPPGATSITLNFNSFKLEANNDSLIIYNGTDANGTKVATYYGQTLPPTTTINSGNVFIEFITNNTINDEGWNLTYTSSPTCSGTTTFTATSGTFDDGSGTVDYENNLNCSWLIQPTGAVRIDLDFNNFITQTVADVVTVYDGNSSSSPVLGTYSGSPTVPFSLNSSGGSMFLEFTTDATNELAGWEATYTSTNIANLSTNEDTITINAGFGSSGNFNVSSNISWSVSDNATWLITSPINGKGNQTVNAQAIQANIGPIRYAEVYIKTNAGSKEDTVIVQQLSSGRYLIANPDTIRFTDVPIGTKDIDLATNVSWNLNSTAPWFSLGSLSGSNNGTVSVTAQSNTSNQIRSDIVVASGNFGVSNDTIVIVQDTAVADQLSLSKKNIILTQPMGSLDSFVVNSNIVWQASAADPWLNLTLPSTTSDTGKIIVTTNSMNPNANSRSTYVAVQDVGGTLFDTVFVSQLGTVITLQANPDTILLSAANGSTADVSVSSNTNWTSIAGVMWFSPSPSSGNSNGTITLSTNSSNSTSNRRISFLALRDVANSIFDTVVVIQDTTTQGLVTTPDTIRLNATNGSSASFSVSTNFNWIATPNNNWVSVNPSSNTGSTTITVTANSANPTSTERTTYVAVVATTGSINEDTVYVVQEASNIKLEANPSSVNLGSTAGSNDIISVTSNTSWSVTNPVTWLSVGPASGTNDGTVTLTTATANLSGSNRSTSLTFSATGVSDQVVTVNQIDGSTPSFEVSVDTVVIDNPQGSKGSFAILSDQSNWKLDENTPWLLINPTTGSNTATITALVASRNVLGERRYAKITASANGFNDKKVVIAQEGSTPLFQVAPDSLTLGFTVGNEAKFNISSNLTSWKISENASWMSVSPDSGSFTAQITIEATETNTTGQYRSEIVTISSPPLVPRTIKVTQDTIWSVGINENLLRNSINLYPNPTLGTLNLELNKTINTDQLVFELFNVIGEKLTIQSNFISSHTIRINLEDYPKGIYFIRINLEKESLTKKIILE